MRGWLLPEWQCALRGSGDQGKRPESRTWWWLLAPLAREPITGITHTGWMCECPRSTTNWPAMVTLWRPHWRASETMLRSGTRNGRGGGGGIVVWGTIEFAISSPDVLKKRRRKGRDFTPPEWAQRSPSVGGAGGLCRKVRLRGLDNSLSHVLRRIGGSFSPTAGRHK